MGRIARTSAPRNPSKPATDLALEFVGQPAAIAMDEPFNLALRGAPPRIPQRRDKALKDPASPGPIRADGMRLVFKSNIFGHVTLLVLSKTMTFDAVDRFA
jgi:hypothetical protein